MGSNTKRKAPSLPAFVCVVIFSAAMVVLSVYNIVLWRSYPYFGFGYLFAKGYRVVARATETGVSAGIRNGDFILTVNGKSFSTFREFRHARDPRIGGDNTYLVKRNGREIAVTVKTVPMGYRRALKMALPANLVGICFIVIGILVFLMKPFQRVSWTFLLFMCTVGTFMLFLNRPTHLVPHWLEFVHIFVYAFVPAGFIHLGLSFPEETRLLNRHPGARFVPYIFSTALFLYISATEGTLFDAPKWCITAIGLYLAAGTVFFLAVCLKRVFRSSSEIARLRSKVMLIGFGVGSILPVCDFLLGTVSNDRILPAPVFYVPFFLAFPISVGYSIVKHNLFDFDAIIKRTYGYVLTTGVVAGAYALFAFVTDLFFGRLSLSKSPLFPLSFVLAVIFFFNPVRNRIQKYIDRIFYRLDYDYQETVQKISESMRSLLRLDQISQVMIETVLNVIFVESGCILLREPSGKIFRCAGAGGDMLPAAATGESGQNSPGAERNETNPISSEVPLRGQQHYGALPELSADEPLISRMAEGKREVTIYDVREDPVYEESRSQCERVFEKLSATLIVPLIYEEQLVGLMPLGRKKSGKTYRRQDMNLLQTLANQGVVAIRNASLVEEVIEKERMEEELSIARDLQMSMLPAACPRIEGFELAAHCTPAREVGGDFYDFIEMEAGKTGLVLGDVTGKSVSGALVTAASRSVLRILSEEGGLSVDQIMKRANRRTKKDITSGMFVALLLGVIESGGRVLSLSNAGQTQPVLFSSKTGEASLVETEGDTFPLGIIDESDYRETRLRLEPGDKVVFYTDGIVEAMNGEQEIFGFDRLIETVKEFGSAGADQLLGEILSRVSGFVGATPQHDDITLITLEVTN